MDKTEKPYIAFVTTADGEELCNKGFDLPQRARGKVCRVMAENPGSQGKVIYTKVSLPSTGAPMEDIVSREEAMRSLHGSKGKPVTHSKKVGSTANNMRAHQTRCSFSHG